MKLYRTILMATDFSQTSEDAFEEALRIAREAGGALRLIHVYEMPAPSAIPYVTAQLYEGLDSEIRSSAERKLETLASRAVSAGVPATSILREGFADVEILGAAERERAELIVLGTHGRRAASRLLIGSVAARVAAAATCPVLTVRPRSIATAARKAS